MVFGIKFLLSRLDRSPWGLLSLREYVTTISTGYADVINQFVTCCPSCVWSKNGLYRHTTVRCKPHWAIGRPGDGQSVYVGAYDGCYKMLLVDVLEFIPLLLIEKFSAWYRPNNVADAVKRKLQDPKTSEIRYTQVIWLKKMRRKGSTRRKYFCSAHHFIYSHSSEAVLSDIWPVLSRMWLENTRIRIILSRWTT